MKHRYDKSKTFLWCSQHYFRTQGILSVYETLIFFNLTSFNICIYENELHACNLTLIFYLSNVSLAITKSDNSASCIRISSPDLWNCSMHLDVSSAKPLIAILCNSCNIQQYIIMVHTELRHQTKLFGILNKAKTFPSAWQIVAFRHLYNKTPIGM